MIVFICPEPTAANERDGLVQRVKAIDSAFASHERLILSLSYTGNLRRKIIVKSPLLRVEYLNVILHWSRIARLARSASAVYVHSCTQAQKILPLYFALKNIVTDLHGVVVEEAAMDGRRLTCWRYRHIERIVVKRSAGLVFVTQALRKHIESKYGALTGSSWIVPIFTKLPPASQGVTKQEDLVIYSGGLHSWQCIHPMVAAAASAQDRLRFHFLTNDPPELRRICARAGLAAQVESVPWSALSARYASASFGFVLRDNSVVNIVACPTKLIEYLYFGVIPIVQLEDIGDFSLYGYRYIRLADFLAGRLPGKAELDEARAVNGEIVKRMAEHSQEQLNHLVKTLTGEMITEECMKRMLAVTTG